MVQNGLLDDKMRESYIAACWTEADCSGHPILDDLPTVTLDLAYCSILHEGIGSLQLISLNSHPKGSLLPKYYGMLSSAGIFCGEIGAVVFL
jgi:hypothetical protein